MVGCRTDNLSLKVSKMTYLDRVTGLESKNISQLRSNGRLLGT